MHCSTKASLTWMAARASRDTAVRPTIHLTCHTAWPNRPEALSTGTHCLWLPEVLLHTLKRWGSSKVYLKPAYLHQASIPAPATEYQTEPPAARRDQEIVSYKPACSLLSQCTSEELTQRLLLKPTAFTRAWPRPSPGHLPPILSWHPSSFTRPPSQTSSWLLPDKYPFFTWS